MASKIGKRMRDQRIWNEQKVALIQFMEAHPELAGGELLVGREGKRKADELWAELLKSVNTCGPPKSINQWKRAYANFRDKARRKASALRAYRCGTGGISAPAIRISELEARVIGMPYIPYTYLIPEVSMSGADGLSLESHFHPQVSPTTGCIPVKSTLPASPSPSSNPSEDIEMTFVDSPFSDDERAVQRQHRTNSQLEDMPQRVDGVRHSVTKLKYKVEECTPGVVEGLRTVSQPEDMSERVDEVRQVVTCLEHKVEEGFSRVVEGLRAISQPEDMSDRVDRVRLAVKSLKHKVEKGFSGVVEGLDRIAVALEALVQRLPNPQHPS